VRLWDEAVTDWYVAFLSSLRGFADHSMLTLTNREMKRYIETV